jgi:hypothetical protein
LGDPKQQNLQDPQSLNSCSYSDDNPIVKTDPSGKLVELVSRPVFAVDGYYIGSHTFFEALPDQPNQIHMTGLPYGTTGFTLGAFPNQLNNLFTSQLTKGMGTNDSLAYDSEYAFGSKPIISRVAITPPNGESDTQFINNLGDAYNNIDLTGTGYWPLGNVPGLYNANSNNFTYTLGTNVGVQSQMNAFASRASGGALGGAAGYGHALPTTSIYGQMIATLHSIKQTIAGLIKRRFKSEVQQCGIDGMAE